MLTVACGQSLWTADVIGQVVMSWALLSAISQCRAEAGTDNRCAGGDCGSDVTSQHDQLISNAQVNRR